MWVIVYGDPINGLKFIGPFVGRSAAIGYGLEYREPNETEDHGVISQNDYWLAPLERCGDTMAYQPSSGYGGKGDGKQRASYRKAFSKGSDKSSAQNGRTKDQ